MKKTFYIPYIVTGEVIAKVEAETYAEAREKSFEIMYDDIDNMSIRDMNYLQTELDEVSNPKDVFHSILRFERSDGLLSALMDTENGNVGMTIVGTPDAVFEAIKEIEEG